MTQPTYCPECGAAWQPGAGEPTCVEAFYTLLGWEHEYQLMDVHHLLVLCFYLQHPGRYSPEGLRGAQSLLVQFVEGGARPEQTRVEIRGAVDSGRRKFKVKAAPGASAAYDHPVQWSTRAPDIVAAGVEAYTASVKSWAASVLADLRASNNIL